MRRVANVIRSDGDVYAWLIRHNNQPTAYALEQGETLLEHARRIMKRVRPDCEVVAVRAQAFMTDVPTTSQPPSNIGPGPYWQEEVEATVRVPAEGQPCASS